jgi:O-antigen/teichoic acid export membrane protein
MNPPAIQTGGLLEVAASTVLTGALNYANTLLLGRNLAANEYGQYAALTALFLAMTVLPSAVQQQAALEGARGQQQAALEGARGLKLNTRTLILGGLFSTIGLSALTPWLSAAMGLPSVWLVSLAALMPAYALLGFWRGLLQGEGQLRSLALNWLLEHSLKIVLTLALWRFGGLEAAVLGLFASVLLALCLIPRPNLRGAALNRLEFARGNSRTAQNASVNQLAQAALTQGDLLAAKAFLPAPDAGLYAGVGILTRSITLLSAAVTTVILPELARSGPSARTRLLSSLPIMLGIILTISSVMAGPELIALTLGERYRDGAGWLTLSSLAATLYALVNAIASVRIARDDTFSARLLLLTAAAQAVAFAIWHDDALTIASVQAGSLLILTTLLLRPETRKPSQQPNEVNHVLRRL